jgi:hypothetical protein
MKLIPHSSWNIHDATKLQTYMDCPRSYFYEYVLGWRSDRPNIHLEFGSAWHLAMEHLINNGYNDASILEAYQKLTTYYRQFFPELMDDANHPKTPAMAFKALVEYAKEYKNDTFQPLYTEIAGTVSLTDRISLHFRMDSILGTPDGIKSREHKTGSQLSRQWMDQWSLKMQTGVYNHVLYCLFPPDKVWGVEINGTIFSKKEVKFQRVPARRTLQAMEVWYWNTIWWIEEIQKDFERLANCSQDDTVLRCFKMNTENCTKYFGCKYHDFCVAWPNPLSRCEEVPVGMKIEYWDPADTSDAKHVFSLGPGTENKEVDK